MHQMWPPKGLPKCEERSLFWFLILSILLMFRLFWVMGFDTVFFSCFSACLDCPQPTWPCVSVAEIVALSPLAVHVAPK